MMFECDGCNASAVSSTMPAGWILRHIQDAADAVGAQAHDPLHYCAECVPKLNPPAEPHLLEALRRLSEIRNIR